MSFKKFWFILWISYELDNLKFHNNFIKLINEQNEIKLIEIIIEFAEPGVVVGIEVVGAWVDFWVVESSSSFGVESLSRSFLNQYSKIIFFIVSET